MPKSTLRRRRSSRGGVFVETALIFIVFASMLIGAFDFGQFLFIHQALTERARYAARWGAINDPTNTTAVQNMVLYNQSTTPMDGRAGYFGLTKDWVQVSTAGSGTDDYRLVLLITNYPYQIFSPYIAGTYTGPNISVSVPLGLNN
jgi:Flp pilus assembly protein TadG